MDFKYGHTIRRMLADSRLRRIPQVLRVAMLGTVAALPATVLINWLPNSQATVGGGVLIVGPVIAGAVATKRSLDPSAAGLRGGFLAGIVTISVFILTEGTTVNWSLNTISFFIIASVMLLSLSPVFGLISGRIGGWVLSTVTDSKADRA